MTPPTVLFVLLFCASLAASAFFAASETALVALGRIELARLRDRRVRRSETVEQLKRNPARLLSVALIGQNLFNSAASALATVVAENLYGEKVGIVVAIAASTILLFTFGEMTPKSIAAASPSRVALLLARPFQLFSRVVGPLAGVVIIAVTRTLKALGVPETRPALTEEEMKAVINMGHAAGVLGAEERQLMVRVLQFRNRNVAEVMVPRPDIVAVPETASLAEVRRVLSSHKFSRIPVYRETLDNVIGILKAKDLFDLTKAQAEAFSVGQHVSPPVLVPEFKRLDELFRDMRRRKQHLAIAVDEYGGTAGLVTIEDVLESLLGSIEDEYDEESPGFVKVADRTYILDGSFRLEELAERFGLIYPRTEVETVAGLLLLRLGRIPKNGERWRGRQAEFVVLDATKTAIRKVKMTLPSPDRGRAA
jgi:CBS domain containing-hemolysin-like protein